MVYTKSRLNKKNIKETTEFLKFFFDYNNKRHHRFNYQNENFDYNYSGFAFYTAHKFNILNDTEFKPSQHDLSEINKELVKNIIKNKNYDTYFAVNRFISQKFINQNAKKQKKVKCDNDNVASAQDLWLDVDATYIDSIEEAKKELYSILEKLDIPKPHAIINTSTTDETGVKLHIHWLLYKLWIYDSQKDRFNVKLRKQQFKKLQESLITVFKSETDWDIDTKSKDLSAYARVPNTINQKTNQVVKLIEFNKEKRFNFEDFNHLKKKAFEINTENQADKKIVKLNNKNVEFDLTKTREFKVMVREGVKCGWRNKAQVLVAKMMFNSAVSLNKAREVIKVMNNNCEQSKNDKISNRQAVAVVNSIYNNQAKNIKLDLAKTIFQAGTGQKVSQSFSYKILSIYDEVSASGYKSKNAYDSKKEVVMRAVVTILDFYNEDREFTKRDIAEEANVSYNNLTKKSYYSKIIDVLKKEFNIYIIYNAKQHTYLFVSITNEKQISVTDSDLKQIQLKYFDPELFMSL